MTFDSQKLRYLFDFFCFLFLYGFFFYSETGPLVFLFFGVFFLAVFLSVLLSGTSPQLLTLPLLVTGPPHF